MDQQNVRWLSFSGKGEDFPAWSERFLAFCRTKALYKTVLGREEFPQEVAPLEGEADQAARTAHARLVTARERTVGEIKERQDQVWCHLAMCLDTTSLMYVRHDAATKMGQATVPKPGRCCRNDSAIWRRLQCAR